MKQEDISYQTKTKLAQSLKKYMLKKPLNKITVSELIQDCKINRKTFYYHFENIYALLKWMLEQEAIDVIKEYNLLVDYQQAILFVINYVESNEYLLNCACDSLGRTEMKHFLFSDFYDITRSVIDGKEKELKLHVQDEFKDFLCILYTEAIAGMLMDWLSKHDHKDKQQIISYFSLILNTSIPAVLQQSTISLPKK